MILSYQHYMVASLAVACVISKLFYLLVCEASHAYFRVIRMCHKRWNSRALQAQAEKGEDRNITKASLKYQRNFMEKQKGKLDEKECTICLENYKPL